VTVGTSSLTYAIVSTGYMAGIGSAVGTGNFSFFKKNEKKL
jgi:hypothetical protein